jgi:FixJ family two-component response regulator/HD-like signal output (HDOD) protein
MFVNERGSLVSVLVVDDDELVRQSLGRNLRRLGCDVLFAEDGEAALRIALDASPAVIFLDLRMPGLDGHTVLRRLPATGVDASVVVMSGHGEVDDVIDALRMGAIDYLRKPWTTTDLASALARAIEVSNALRDVPRLVGTEESSPVARLAALAGSPQPGDGLRTPAGEASGRGAADPGEDRGPFADIAERLRAGSVVLPPAPPVLTRLRRMVEETAASRDAEEVVALVERDPPLRTALLVLASSGAERGETARADEVRAAVARVSLPQIHALAETLALRDATPARVPALRLLQDKIWRFSVARGLAMRAIAEVAGPQIELDGDHCYLAGVLLDVGAEFLIQRWAETEWTPGRSAEIAAGEPALTIVAAHHAVFSQALLSSWGISAEVVALAGAHHLDTAPVDIPPLWCAGVSAGALAGRLVGFEDPLHQRPQRSELRDRCAYTLGLGETVLRRLGNDLARDLPKVWALYA